MLGKGNKKINKKDQENTTALHYAVRYNHLHIVKLLLDYGAGKEQLEQLITLCNNYMYIVWQHAQSSETDMFSDIFIIDPLKILIIINLDYNLNDPHTFGH